MGEQALSWVRLGVRGQLTQGQQATGGVWALFPEKGHHHRVSGRGWHGDLCFRDGEESRGRLEARGQPRMGTVVRTEVTGPSSALGMVPGQGETWPGLAPLCPRSLRMASKLLDLEERPRCGAACLSRCSNKNIGSTELHVVTLTVTFGVPARRWMFTCGVSGWCDGYEALEIILGNYAENSEQRGRADTSHSDDCKDDKES